MFALHYLNRFFSKLELDKKFKEENPHRFKNEEESFEEYDDYLTKHLELYNRMLESNNMSHLLSNDYHFLDKIQQLKVNENVVLKDKLSYRELVGMMAALFFYEFTLELNQQKTKYPHLENIRLQRKNTVVKYLGDVWLLISTFKNDAVVLVPQLLVAETNPTWLSRLSKKIFLTKNKQYGTLNEALKGIASGETKT